MKSLKYFLILMLCYHILMTGLGGFGIESNALLSAGKDMIRIVVVLVMIFRVKNGEWRAKSLLGACENKTILRSMIILIVLSLLGVGYSYQIETDLNQIIIGFKYTLWPLVILMGSVVVGVVVSRTKSVEGRVQNMSSSRLNEGNEGLKDLVKSGGETPISKIHTSDAMILYLGSSPRGQGENDFSESCGIDLSSHSYHTSTSSVGQYIGIYSINSLSRIIVGVIVLGFIRQISKLLLPDFFVQFGYGPVGDFVVGQAAPIWYRTGPGGAMRRQGIFAGPNNYGYFLTAFASVIGVWVMSLWNDKKKVTSIVVGTLFLLAVGLTYSRGALLGVGVQVFLLLWIMKPHWKRVFYGLVLVLLISMIGLSIWKRGSTVLHFQAWFDGISALLANPWGYGLGSSGPSVHYEGVYLPENQYLQVALDLGIWGLLGWIGVRVVLLQGVWKRMSNNGVTQSVAKSLNYGTIDSSIVRSSLNLNDYCHPEVSKDLLKFGDKSEQVSVSASDSLSIDRGSGPGGYAGGTLNSELRFLISLLLGGIGLAVIGMFLHVLEDSMVNYRYLSLLGITIGSVLTYKKISCNQ